MTPPPRTRTFTDYLLPLRPLPGCRIDLRDGQVLNWAFKARFGKQGSGHALQCIAEDRHDVVDVAAFDDQRRRHGDGVAGHAEHEAAVEAVDHDLVGAAAWCIRPRRKLDA